MKKLAGVNVCFIYSPFESRAKCKCHRGSIIFPAFQLLFSLHSKRQPHFFCVTFFYLIRYYETAYSFINPLVVLNQPALTVSDTRWHLLSSDVFLINADTILRWQFLVRDVVFQSRCHLPIRGCQLLNLGKNSNGQIRSQDKNIFARLSKKNSHFPDPFIKLN